jgi:hypothetical protein
VVIPAGRFICMFVFRDLPPLLVFQPAAPNVRRSDNLAVGRTRESCKSASATVRAAEALCYFSAS